MPQSSVYFVPLSEKSSVEQRASAMEKMLNVIAFSERIAEKDKVAIKMHVGEKKNTTHITPQVIRKVVLWAKSKKALPFLTETATLYKGARNNAIDHLNHAYNHGFTYNKIGAPFIMADGLLGNTEIEVAIPGQIYKTVHLAREVVGADALIAVSHPTGHLATGIGACIKNLGMGLASRIGKLRQHSSIKPYIKIDLCTFCKLCIRWCPEEAIIEKDSKAFIIEDNCTGCGECLAVCHFDAVAYNWGVESHELQKRMVEHAFGIIIDKKEKCLFVNVLTDMTKDCDCFSVAQKPVLPDIGIIASIDPIAIDQATLDLTAKKGGKNLSNLSYPALDPTVQLVHGENIGMGSRDYKLVTISS